jgi:predicted small lipoprotein YifL
MRRLPWLAVLAVLILVAGCSLKGGRSFPSPALTSIVVGVTDKAALERAFGPPYQVGVDSGDPTWRWFYVERRLNSEITKDLSVRFDPDGIVKAYSFTSNFPEDMGQLK